MTNPLTDEQTDVIIQLMELVSHMGNPSVEVCTCGCGSVSIIDQKDGSSDVRQKEVIYDGPLKGPVDRQKH